MHREDQVETVVIATHCELVRTLQDRKPPHSASITPVSPYKQTEPTRIKTSSTLAKATFQCALARFELCIYLIDASVNQIDMRWSVYLLFVYFIRHHTQSQD